MQTLITFSVIVPTDQADATEAQIRTNLADVEDCNFTITRETVDAPPEEAKKGN